MYAYNVPTRSPLCERDTTKSVDFVPAGRIRFQSGLPILAHCTCLNANQGYGVQSRGSTRRPSTHSSVVQDEHRRDSCVVWTSEVTSSRARSHRNPVCRLQPVRLPVTLVPRYQSRNQCYCAHACFVLMFAYMNWPSTRMPASSDIFALDRC